MDHSSHIARSQTPEERELAKKKAELITLEAELAEARARRHPQDHGVREHDQATSKVSQAGIGKFDFRWL
jgi:hypothetical protein